MKRRLKQKDIEKALRVAGGNVTGAADRLGVPRSTLYRRIKQSKRLQEVLEECREVLIDEAEAALTRRVRQGHMSAVTFVLKTLGKNRGYVERQEIEHSGLHELVVKVHIVRPDMPDASA